MRCEAQYDSSTWRCLACGFEPVIIEGFPAFAPELASDASGFNAALYAALAQVETNNFWFRSRNRLIAWALKRYFRGARNFLEIGCGTGFVLTGVAAALPALELYGSEVLSSGLGYASKRVPQARLMQMDARNIPFADEFDVIGAFDVIEHIEEDHLVLRQIRRALAANGGILLTVPQHPFLWSQYDVHARHVRRYRARELRERVINAGFEIVRMTSFVTLLLPFMMLSRLVPRAPEQGYDPFAEFRLHPLLNAVLEKTLDLERAVITSGLTLPVGGSLLLVGRKR